MRHAFALGIIFQYSFNVFKIDEVVNNKGFFYCQVVQIKQNKLNSFVLINHELFVLTYNKNSKVSTENMEDQHKLQSLKFKQNPKSSLNPNTGQNSSKNIQYISKISNLNDPIEISDQQKQQEMNKQRQEYILEKLNQKKEMLRLKKIQFGSSSSEEDDVGVEGSLSGHSEENIPKMQEKIIKSSEKIVKQSDESNFLLKFQKVYQLQGKQNWNQLSFLLKDKVIMLNEQEYEIPKIHKIKSIPMIVNKNLLKIKLSYNSEDLMLAASKQPILYKKQKLSVHYLIFASIITRKLEMMELKFYQLEKNVPGVPESIIKNSLIYGKIYKKSQILRRWEERLVIVNEIGIYSYKRLNEPHSMFIAAKSVKEIWTRFEIVDENLLVIKILHSSNTKTQFGIPITDFFKEKNWLFQFYHLGISPFQQK